MIFRAVPSRQKQISSGLLVGMSLIHVFSEEQKQILTRQILTCLFRLYVPEESRFAANGGHGFLHEPLKSKQVQCRTVTNTDTQTATWSVHRSTGPHPHWQGIYLQKERASPSLSLAARKYAFVDWIFDKSAVIKLSAMSSYGSNLILSFINWKIVCLPLIPIHRACQTSLLTQLKVQTKKTTRTLCLHAMIKIWLCKRIPTSTKEAMAMGRLSLTLLSKLLDIDCRS